jgi:hypothetical protein
MSRAERLPNYVPRRVPLMNGTSRRILLGFTAMMLTWLTTIHAMDTDRMLSPVGGVAASQKVEANRVAEISLVSERTYQNPFMEVEIE